MSTIASSNAHSTISHHQSPHTHINLQRLARSTHKATTTAISPRPNQPNQIAPSPSATINQEAEASSTHPPTLLTLSPPTLH
jgi:hypothetical protein